MPASPQASGHRRGERHGGVNERRGAAKTSAEVGICELHAVGACALPIFFPLRLRFSSHALSPNPLRSLEDQMHNRLASQVQRDRSRFQYIMKIMRTRCRRRPGDSDKLRLHREDFHDVLTAMGVVCTPPQAMMLFDKYDEEREGHCACMHTHTLAHAHSHDT